MKTVAKKIAKVIRVVTVAPLMAFVMLLALYLAQPGLFGGLIYFLLLVLFLVLFPLLGYPLQPLIKPFREQGRDGQRTLAMIFAVAGYVLGFVTALLLHAGRAVLVIYLSYLLSGALIVLFNKLFHYKASGHACGVTGPFAILVCFGQALGYIGIPILAAVCWASLAMRRHTAQQLIGGAAIPLVALLIAVKVSFLH